ncbi:hypothetical protein DKT77_19080 [Meridianimarinicoccus roseus]|uniref:eCIS core domain-containing protein n=2 Tax=Meridianimarinicoccus roseus TaxID=2072018 RepID=A0A2V2LCP9_9RHOB|nr:hypothetical protein DKT77_19080 [Meridianimarinicoccus roseus]
MALRAPKRAVKAATAPETGRTRPFFTPTPVQARLRVGRPGDRFETEADHAADAVVHGRGPLSTSPVAAQLTPTEGLGAQRTPMDEEVQKAGTEEEEVQTHEGEEAQAKADKQYVQAAEEEEAQTKAEEDEVQAAGEDEAQTKSELDEVQPVEEQEAVQARGPSAAPGDPDRVSRGLRAGRGQGSPLPDDVRARMEARFGAGLSGVRVHTDALAVQLTRALNAQAFANGHDIYFNEGRYAPGTPDGDHLLAHELAHTVQQGATEVDTVRLSPETDEKLTMHVRPEALQAIALARGEIGKVNSKLMGANGERIGADRLLEYFRTAFGGDTIHPQIVRRITMVEKPGKAQKEDALPHWCGIFTWWALKTAGVPLPDWTIGMNILDSVEARPPGTLPRKGDIAWRTKNQHFALVSGVDAGDVAAGTPVSDTRIATVNGNTAGADNLGGQIQEIWGPVSEWHVFFDPMAKLPMPDVALVETSLDPLEIGPVAEEGAAATAPEPLEQTGAPQTAADALPVPAEKAPDDEVGLMVPSEPAMPPPPAPDKIAAPDLSGGSEAAVTAMASAAPAAMVETATQGFGATITQRLGSEQKAAADNAPEIAVQSGGALDLTTTSPERIGKARAEIGDGVKGERPRDLTPTPQENRAPAPSTAEGRREMDHQPEGGFLAWLRGAIRGLIRGIRTTDDGVNTSAGPRERVALEGDADTGRLARQQGEAQSQMRQERDRRSAAFRSHPGQSNVQPRQLDERRRPTLRQAPETTPEEVTPSEEATGYRDARLGDTVRPLAEKKVAEQIDASGRAAAEKARAAASTRDTERDAKVAAARSEAAEASRSADANQTRIVNAGRADIAAKQGKAIGDAHAQVAAFSEDATKEQTAKRNAIGDHVRTEEGKAHKKLDDAETEAANKKREKEKEAGEKKKKLEEDQKKDSWWSRAANAVKRAVKAVTEAIDAVFTALRNAVKTIIEAAKNAAIGLINAARNWVVARLNDFRDWAKAQVDTYLRDRFPGLADALDGAIDTVVDTAIAGVNAVADAAVAVVERVAGALAAALDRILGAFQTALTAAVGVLGAVLTGDFAGALRIAIQAGCDIAGVDSGPIFRFIDRAGGKIMAILKDLPGFFSNLVTAVGRGIRKFGTNILQHLQTGLIGWLTGALGGAGITLPQNFDLKGIFGLVTRVLGLTYENVKARVVRKFPAAEGIFTRIEQGMEIIGRIRREGLSAIWDMVHERLNNLYEMVIGTIRNWVVFKVIKAGILWLISLLNPASMLARALKLMFDLVMWLVQRFAQIRDFVMSVYGAVTNIAAGMLDPAAKAVENALVRSLPVVISLIASVLGLGGISAAIQRVVQRVTAPINRAIDWVIDRVVAFARRLVKGLKKGARKVRDKVAALLWPKKRFRVNGESHSLEFRKDGTPMMRSSPKDVKAVIKAWKDSYRNGVPADKRRDQSDAEASLARLAAISGEIKKLELKSEKVPATRMRALIDAQLDMSEKLKKLIGYDTVAARAIAAGEKRFLMEGRVGTYESMLKMKGDALTPDHQPQNTAIQWLSKRTYFKKAPRKMMIERAKNRTAKGYAINLSHRRHVAGRTYGKSPDDMIARVKGVEANFAGQKNAARNDTGLTSRERAERLVQIDRHMRVQAVDHLQIELRADVARMNEVVALPITHKAYSDLPPLFEKLPSAEAEKATKTLSNQIRARIKSGQALIARQPMRELRE